MLGQTRPHLIYFSTAFPFATYSTRHPHYPRDLQKSSKYAAKDDKQGMTACYPICTVSNSCIPNPSSATKALYRLVSDTSTVLYARNYHQVVVICHRAGVTGVIWLSYQHNVQIITDWPTKSAKPSRIGFRSPL